MGVMIKLFIEDTERELSVKIWNDIAKENNLDYHVSQPVVDFRVPLYVNQKENSQDAHGNNNNQPVETEMIIKETEGLCSKEINKTPPLTEDNDLHLESVVERRQKIGPDIDNNPNLLTSDNAETEDVENVVPVNVISVNDSNGQFQNDGVKIRSALIESESWQKSDVNSFVRNTDEVVLIGDPLNDDENSRSTVDYNETQTCDDLFDVEETSNVGIIDQEHTVSQQMSVNNVPMNSHDIKDDSDLEMKSFLEYLNDKFVTIKYKCRKRLCSDTSSSENSNQTSCKRRAIKKSLKETSGVKLRSILNDKEYQKYNIKSNLLLKLRQRWKEKQGFRRAPCETSDECFSCKKPGVLLHCDEKSCQRGFHLECVQKAECPTEEIWLCDQHFCEICKIKENLIKCFYCKTFVCQTHTKEKIFKAAEHNQFACEQHVNMPVTSELVHDGKRNPVNLNSVTKSAFTENKRNSFDDATSVCSDDFTLEVEDDCETENYANKIHVRNNEICSQISDIENIIIDVADFSVPVLREEIISSTPAGSSSAAFREIAETSKSEGSVYEKRTEFSELKMPSSASKKKFLQNTNSRIKRAFSRRKPTDLSEVMASSDATKKKLLDNTNSYRCSRCELRIPREMPRKTHFLTCKGAFFVCKPCNEAFTNKKSLLAHRAKETCVAKSQCCEICGRAFSTSVKLMNHLKEIHPSKCNEMKAKKKQLLSEGLNNEQSRSAADKELESNCEESCLNSVPTAWTTKTVSIPKSPVFNEDMPLSMFMSFRDTSLSG